MELKDISGIGEKTLATLTKHEIVTTQDLLTYFPRTYREYFPRTSHAAQVGEWVSLVGTVTRPVSHHTAHTTTQLSTLRDGVGTLTLRWFNSPFMVSSVDPEATYLVRGQLTVFDNTRQIISPQLTKINSDYQPQNELVPIYTSLGTLKSGNLRKIIASALQSALPIPETLAPGILSAYALTDLSTALHHIHFPPTRTDLEGAIHRLGFDELYALQLESLKNRELNQVKTEPLHWAADTLTRWLSELPFTPTSAQTREIATILADLGKPIAMHRLLQGEVGSGKTLVAAAAALATHLAGRQTLLLAPTQILAEQLHTAMEKLLGRTLKVSLVTHSTKGDTHADIVVGTQALLQDKLSFKSIGLVIVDEQHRFGVEQRLLLTKVIPAPHFLMMTATPIPRTLAMTLFAGLDIGYLDELPKNRLPIKTFYVGPEKRDSAYSWIRQEIVSHQNQAFVVVPLIDEAEDEEGNAKKSIASLETDLKARFPGLPIDVMHGRMKPAEKTARLQAFRDGAIQILVATSMVEVGIDIPTANIMVIEDAERFGLSQLHQLRGRVGRGGEQGYCLLFVGAGSSHPSTQDRIKYFVRETSGTKLAEYDLQSRGPGELFGTSQHGFFSLRFASLYDEELLRQTAEAVRIHPI
jgi:ATP-dependent DNA helicase RecG